MEKHTNFTFHTENMRYNGFTKGDFLLWKNLVKNINWNA